MAKKKVRSPVTDKVFDGYLESMRAEEGIDAALCDRLEELLGSGQAITPTAVRLAFFPVEGAPVK